MEPTTLLSPFRLPAKLVERLKNHAKSRGCSITHCLQSAIARWLDEQEGAIEDKAREEADLRESREKEAVDAQARRAIEREKEGIAWLERWKTFSPGKKAPWPKNKPIPAGYEDMIDREEEI